jgi:serine protease Do
MNRIRWYGPTVVLILTVLLVMVLGPGLVRQIAWAQQDQKIHLIREDLAGNSALAELSNAFRKVSQIVEPSVVSIQVSARQVPGRRGGGMSPDEQLRRFFGPQLPAPSPFDEDEDQDQPGPGVPNPHQQPAPDDNSRFNVPRPYGSGSGWVYDTEGHIITNNHVVNGADVITVRFNDGSERTAKLVNADAKTDIAVIKVEGGNLHPADRAELAKNPVEQGDMVFAFGSPFRFEFSMSQGIVSAKGRQLGIIHDNSGLAGYENFIQTDAAINPGNSGGPLTNIYGQVVGMNTAIASRTGSYNGIGFAIPIDMVENVVQQIIKNGKVTRGYLGIYIEDLDPKMAKSFGFDGKGVLVRSPIEGSPGAKAGIKPGDIITKINGTAVTTAEALRSRVANFAPGEKVSLEYFRDGKLQNADVTIAEQPNEVARGPGMMNGNGGSGTAKGPSDQSMEQLRKLGIETVSEFSADMAAQLKLQFTPGVIVRRVRPDSEAASKGIAPGTVITKVMGADVKTPEDLGREIAKHDLSKGVRLSVVENGIPRFVLLELPK